MWKNVQHHLACASTTGHTHFSSSLKILFDTTFLQLKQRPLGMLPGFSAYFIYKASLNSCELFWLEKNANRNVGPHKEVRHTGTEWKQASENGEIRAESQADVSHPPYSIFVSSLPGVVLDHSRPCSFLPWCDTLVLCTFSTEQEGPRTRPCSSSFMVGNLTFPSLFPHSENEDAVIICAVHLVHLVFCKDLINDSNSGSTRLWQQWIKKKKMIAWNTDIGEIRG